jgi:Xaa-Pro aminopeptidase
MRKSPWEVEQLGAASRAADATFEALVATDLEGASEREALARIHHLLLENGHEAVGGGIVGAGENGASPHHHSGDTKIEAGSAVVVDFGGSLNNYRSDITRTFHVGEPTPEFRQVYDIVNEANQKAFEFVKPGVRAADLDGLARSFIAEAGYPNEFLHRLGHGIGLEGHESPYLVTGSDAVLEEGMAFSIEPGIYLEGRFGVRIEDIAVVTSDGAQRLNLSSHELVVL